MVGLNAWEIEVLSNPNYPCYNPCPPEICTGEEGDSDQDKWDSLVARGLLTRFECNAGLVVHYHVTSLGRLLVSLYQKHDL